MPNNYVDTGNLVIKVLNVRDSQCVHKRSTETLFPPDVNFMNFLVSSNVPSHNHKFIVTSRSAEPETIQYLTIRSMRWIQWLLNQLSALSTEYCQALALA